MKIRTSTLRNEPILKDRFLISLFLFFLFGFLIGVFTLSSLSKADNNLFEIISLYIQNRFSQSILASFIGTVTSVGAVFFCAYFMGLSAIGLPFIHLISAYDGLTKGVFLSFICINFGFLGFLKALVFIIPFYTLYTAVLLYALKKAIVMSTDVFKTLNLKNPENINIRFVRYNKRFIAISIFLFVYCVIDSLMSRLYSVF